MGRIIVVVSIVMCQAVAWGKAPSKNPWSLKCEYKPWSDAKDPSRNEGHWYIPGNDLGLSSLTFDSQRNRFYSACEKYPVILSFDKSGGDVTLIHLPSSPALDIEALSVYKDTLYIVDEDGKDDTLDKECYQNEETKNQPLIYRYDLKNGKLSPEPLKIDTTLGVSVDCKKRNRTDKKSVEGLVVSDDWLFPQMGSPPPGPYFYLLDEQTNGKDGSYAVLSVAVDDMGTLRPAAQPVKFRLTNESERMPELLVYKGTLCAIKSYFNEDRPRESHYAITQLMLEGEESWGFDKPLCRLDAVANQLLDNRYSSNLEGAAISADGSLFLVTDNENRDPATQSAHPSDRYANGKTALIRLPLAAK